MRFVLFGFYNVFILPRTELFSEWNWKKIIGKGKHKRKILGSGTVSPSNLPSCLSSSSFLPRRSLALLYAISVNGHQMKSSSPFFSSFILWRFPGLRPLWPRLWGKKKTFPFRWHWLWSIQERECERKDGWMCLACHLQRNKEEGADYSWVRYIDGKDITTHHEIQWESTITGE